MPTEQAQIKRTKDKLLRALASPVLDPYDYLALGYTTGQLTSLTFKQGGAAGTTISTTTLGYTEGQLTSLTTV